MGDGKDLVIDAGPFTEIVDTDRLGEETQLIYDFLTSLVIGQDRAARLIVRSLASRAVGLSDPERPEIIVCPGPSGSGKTYSAEVLARCLIYDDEVDPPFIKVDCSELTEHHQLSELRGAPPGYKGCDDSVPRLSQIRIDEHHFFAKLRQWIRSHPEAPLSLVSDPAFLAKFYAEHVPYTPIICFDEFEKGCVELHHFLYSILDKGVVNMATIDGGVTSFRNSIIFLTTNVGDRDVQNILSGQDQRRIGFQEEQSAEQELESVGQKIYDKTIAKMKEVFPGPLIGRMRGRIIVFRPLNRDDLRKILDLMIGRVMKRMRASANPAARQTKVAFSPAFREFVLDEGTSPEFGARELRQAVERHVAFKLACAIENGEIQPDDTLLFDAAKAGEGKYKDPVLKRIPRKVPTVISPPPKEDKPSLITPPPIKVPPDPEIPGLPDGVLGTERSPDKE